MKQKWLLNKKENKYIDDVDESIWTSIHKGGYNIWSISPDPKLQQKILKKLKTIPNERILIIGCGSDVNLQNMICENLPDVIEIACTDFEDVIKIAKTKPNREKIAYTAMDSRRLTYKDYFDVVICVNSILSNIDGENRMMVNSCFNALKPGGNFIGLFPTVMCLMEIESIERRYNRLKRMFLLNKPRQDIIETTESGNQLFYSPLLLRRIFFEAHFCITEFEIFFFDSDEAKAQAKKHYVIVDEDILVYEFFIVAFKNAEQ